MYLNFLNMINLKCNNLVFVLPQNLKGFPRKYCNTSTVFAFRCNARCGIVGHE